MGEGAFLTFQHFIKSDYSNVEKHLIFTYLPNFYQNSFYFEALPPGNIPKNLDKRDLDLIG
tara:strand:- start:99 stop:281 length:183 start_codon:yes stop_codon:yes gene_type:complete